MRQVKRRQPKTEEKEFLLQSFTTLLFLIVEYLHAEEIPTGWGLAGRKKEAKMKLLKFLKKHGAIIK